MRLLLLSLQYFLILLSIHLQGDHSLAEEDLAMCKDMGPDESLAQEIEAELAANKRRAKAAETKQRETFKSFFDR
jgi:uncharacterized MAPEG superfamily protein